jgi:hypothetical protein
MSLEADAKSVEFLLNHGANTELKVRISRFLFSVSYKLDNSPRYRPARLDLHESGTIGYWIDLEKDINHYMFLIF